MKTEYDVAHDRTNDNFQVQLMKACDCDGAFEVVLLDNVRIPLKSDKAIKIVNRMMKMKPAERFEISNLMSQNVVNFASGVMKYS